MAEKSWIDRLNIEFIKLYGVKKAKNAMQNTLSGVITDFIKVLDKSEYNKEITETYHFEDKKAYVTAVGEKVLSAQGEEYRLCDFLMNGKSMEVKDTDSDKKYIILKK